VEPAATQAATLPYERLSTRGGCPCTLSLRASGWGPPSIGDATHIKNWGLVRVLVLVNNKISRDVKGLFLGDTFALDQVKSSIGDSSTAARGRAAPKEGSSVTGSQLGLLGQGTIARRGTVARRYCSAAIPLGFVG